MNAPSSGEGRDRLAGLSPGADSGTGAPDGRRAARGCGQWREAAAPGAGADCRDSEPASAPCLSAAWYYPPAVLAQKLFQRVREQSPCGRSTLSALERLFGGFCGTSERSNGRYACSGAPHAAIVVGVAALLLGLEVSYAVVNGCKFYVASQRRRRERQRRQQSAVARMARRTAADAVPPPAGEEAALERSGTAAARAGRPSRSVRVVSYWGLVEEAVRAGREKAPSPTVTVAEIAAQASLRHVSRRLADRGRELQPGDALLVLPETVCFTAAYLRDAPQGSVDEWSTVHLLWTDSVRYTVNALEIRKLLLSYPEDFFSSSSRCTRRDQAARVAAANLAVAWQLTLVRRVFDALTRHGDTQRCEEDFEELLAYERAVYVRCIAPWTGKRDEHSAHRGESTRGGPTVGVLSAESSATIDGFSPAAAWGELSRALRQLHRLSVALTICSVRSLFHYMYASSRTKFIGGALLAALTALASRVSSAGSWAREAVTQALERRPPALKSSSSSSSSSSPAAAGAHAGGGSTPKRSCARSADVQRDAAAESFNLAEVISLCSFELIRLTVNTVLVVASKQFISATASQRRDAVKAQLYEALTHMPLSFYDLHSYDEIEEIVYYVNDLEGVDVHMHQYIFTTVTSVTAMRLALRPLSREARLLVVGTVACGYIVQWTGSAVAGWYRRSTHRAAGQPTFLAILSGGGVSDGELSTTDDDEGDEEEEEKVPRGAESTATAAVNDDDSEESAEGAATGVAAATAVAATAALHAVRATDGDDDDVDDAQEAENVSSAHCRDGVMLRGLEIIAALPQLRPYGADVPLMAWWNDHTAERQRRHGRGGAPPGSSGALLAALVEETHGRLIPALGTAVLSFIDWFLPLFTSVYGAHAVVAGEGEWRQNGRCVQITSATASGRLLEATGAVKAAVEAALDARRMADVMLRNSYKADVIRRILSPKHWESASAEDIAHVGGCASAESWNSSPLAPPPVMLYRYLTSQHNDSFSEMRATAHSRKPYRNLMVTSIIVSGLQFSYPSNPTVPVFAHPLSADIVLQDSATGKGRLVVLTGPSGQGKSTLLHLLLGLYTTYTTVADDDEREPASDPLSPCSSMTSRLSSGIELCLAERTPAEPARATASAGESTAAEQSQTYSVDLRDVPCSVLRGQLFSYVPQYPTIFAGATIAHNITLSPFVSLEQSALLRRAQQCADEAHCDYIRRFPQGLLTPIGDSGSLWGGAGSAGAGASDSGGLVRLSGGQAQRLMVARALYHGGLVLLMDEPTASLDGVTKQSLLRVWRQLLDSGAVKGIICATHDEAVLAVADQVVSLSASTPPPATVASTAPHQPGEATAERKPTGSSAATTPSKPHSDGAKSSPTKKKAAAAKKSKTNGSKGQSRQ